MVSCRTEKPHAWQIRRCLARGQGSDDEARAALPASEQITGLLADWNGTDGNAAGTTDALFEAVYAT
ncbi:MAG TPA: hypothetical protein DCM36_03930 [Xanthomonadaceae bacterium]|nr:hypothetical protein [Xanthomonadaceae bacterium]